MWQRGPTSEPERLQGSEVVRGHCPERRGERGGQTWATLERGNLFLLGTWGSKEEREPWRPSGLTVTVGQLPVAETTALCRGAGHPPGTVLLHRCLPWTGGRGLDGAQCGGGEAGPWWGGVTADRGAGLRPGLLSLGVDTEGPLGRFPRKLFSRPCPPGGVPWLLILLPHSVLPEAHREELSPGGGGGGGWGGARGEPV